MRLGETPKDNGDVVFAGQHVNNEILLATICVFTKTALHVLQEQDSEEIHEVWQRAGKLTKHGDYGRVLGKNATLVPLADVVRVEKTFESLTDAPCVNVRYVAQGRNRSLDIVVGDHGKLFKRLHRQLAADAPIESGAAPVWKVMLQPVLAICGFGFVAAWMTCGAFLSADSKTPPEQRGKYGRFFHTIGGPWVVLALSVLLVLSPLPWMAWRIYNRPSVRFFETGAAEADEVIEEAEEID